MITLYILTVSVKRKKLDCPKKKAPEEEIHNFHELRYLISSMQRVINKYTLSDCHPQQKTLSCFLNK